ncbi:MAG: GtrA family protein [Turicibacter sp.]
MEINKGGERMNTEKIKTISSVFYKYFLMFGMIGAINTILQQIIYLFFIMGSVQFLLAQVLSFGLALLVSFFLNSTYNYKVKMTWRLFYDFVLANIPACVLQFVILNLLVGYLNINESIGLMVTLVITVPLSFILISMSMLKKKTNWGE